MSERNVVKLGTAHTFPIWVYDSSGVEVTGLVSANFTKKLVKDNVNSAIAVTVTETDAVNLPGRYHVSVTGDAAAVYECKVSHSTHNPKGWTDEFEVTALGIPTVQELVDAVLDLASVIDGKKLRSVFKWLLAAATGKGAGTSAKPFLNPAGDTDRIASTFDSDGARNTVTLTE